MLNILSSVSQVSKLPPAGRLPLCANEVLLQYNYVHFSHIVYGCFCVTSQSNSCDRDSMAYKIKDIYYLTLYRKRLLISDIYI